MLNKLTAEIQAAKRIACLQSIVPAGFWFEFLYLPYRPQQDGTE
jgi:hypothetical protein